MTELVVTLLFLFLKTGEKFATQEAAGPTVAEFTKYAGRQVGGVAFEPQVMNDPIKAVEWCGARQPAVGIVTPGFFLTYAKALGMEPLLETHRQGVGTERFVLVAKKDASENLEDWTGRTIVTSLAAEERYVRGVILQNRLGDELRLKQTGDNEGAVFDLVEGAADAGDAVLLEEAAWKLFAEDAELGGKLKVIYRSDELLAELVVVFRPQAEKLNVERFKAALKAMKDSPDGQPVLRSIRVVEFVDVNQDRLEKARALFQGK